MSMERDIPHSQDTDLQRPHRPVTCSSAQVCTPESQKMVNACLCA